MKTGLLLSVLMLVTLLAAPVGLYAQMPMGTAFSYQGRLTDSGSPANGDYDFTFELYGADTGGNPIGGAVTVDDHPVVNGMFTVPLDFGVDAFDGQRRWLEVAVREGADTGPYTILAPRHELTPVPYAILAGKAANGITGLGTAGYLAQFSNSDTLIDSVLYQNGDKIGLGCTVPGGYAKLHIHTDDACLKLTNSGTGTEYGDGFLLSFQTSGGRTATVWNREDAPLLLGTNNTERVRVDANGNVGIGDTSPSYKLDVAGTVQMTGFRMPNGAVSGYVLRSDASGNGTWQAASNGDITGVDAGSGLVGGGTAGSVTLSVGVGDGIDVAADSVAVDVTDFAGDGLGEDAANNLKVNTSTGLEISSDSVRLTSAYSSGSAYDSRFINDNSGEVDGNDIATGTTVTGSASGNTFTVVNNYSGTMSSTAIQGKCVNTTTSWYHWGVEGLAQDGGAMWSGMRNAGVLGSAASGYSSLHGVIGASYDGRGVWGASGNGYAGYFTGDVHVTGDITASGSKAGWVVDVCCNDSGGVIEAGDVVVLSGKPATEMMYGRIPVPLVAPCSKAADTKVIGVVIKRKMITPFSLEDRVYESREAAAAAGAAEAVEPLRETAQERHVDSSIVPAGRGCDVAILGAIEKCKVDASHAPIAVGDLLTTSPTPGHAMKATEPKLGTIVGKALEPLATGRGVIRISVTLR